MKAIDRTSTKSFSRRRSGFRPALVAVVTLMTFAALLFSPIAKILSDVAAQGVTSSVIIQLTDDPAAVWQVSPPNFAVDSSVSESANPQSPVTVACYHVLELAKDRGPPTGATLAIKQ